MRLVRVQIILFNIVMGVDDDKQALRQRHVHHILHPVQPAFGDAEVIPRYMVVPGDGDAHSFEANILQGFKYPGVRLHAHPGAFIVQFVLYMVGIAGVKGVAQIPAHAQLLHKAEGVQIGQIFFCECQLRQHYFLLRKTGCYHAGQEHHSQQHQNNGFVFHNSLSSLNASFKSGMGKPPSRGYE